MRRIFILIAIFLMASISIFAADKIKGEFKNWHEDANGNLVYEIEYTLFNDTKIYNNYTDSYYNHINKTAEEIESFIMAQMEYQIDRYLEAYSAIGNVTQPVLVNATNDYIDTTLNKTDIQAKLDALKPKVKEKDETTWYITKEARIVTSQYNPQVNKEKEIKFKKDGSYIISNISD